MAFGLGRLRLSSRDFWAMTPREIAAAVEAVAGPARAPLDRAALAALMARFPD
ncbi:putative phage protein (TIGR02216 family) [Angulomicrobium amanitiforme]|uniref:Phage protein (TIGR02216 family) n=2 Tax=Ancylobacter amanitiformis TaxID=217069 RepID=A0ABU0LM22_9HYPH|nr:putative phage protein (TIGR02216 family) [Ancylobacter amanitiformis]